MTDANIRLHDVAVSLMRLALPLLDRAGDTLAAARLQHAIDTALRSPPSNADEEFDLGDLATHGLHTSSK